jgi:hypothetical protein
MKKFLICLILLVPIVGVAQQDTIRMPQATIDRIVGTFKILNDTIRTEQAITFVAAQDVIRQVNQGYESSKLQWFEFIGAKQEVVEETIQGKLQKLNLIRKDEELYAFIPNQFSLIKWDLLNKE